MGVDAGDYDQDGDLDLCQSNLGQNIFGTKKIQILMNKS